MRRARRKALKAGDHLIVPAASGLRLEAGEKAPALIYRYESPVDGMVRQVRIGLWSTISVA